MSEKIGQKRISAYVRFTIRLPFILLTIPLFLFFGTVTTLFIWTVDGEFKESVLFFYKSAIDMFYI